MDKDINDDAMSPNDSNDFEHFKLEISDDDNENDEGEYLVSHVNNFPT